MVGDQTCVTKFGRAAEWTYSERGLKHFTFCPKIMTYVDSSLNGIDNTFNLKFTKISKQIEAFFDRKILELKYRKSPWNWLNDTHIFQFQTVIFLSLSKVGNCLDTTCC